MESEHLQSLKKRYGELSSRIRKLETEKREVEREVERYEREYFKKTGLLPNIPTTANEWELCSAVPGAEEAAKRLTSSLKKALVWFTEQAPKLGPRKAAKRCQKSMESEMAKEVEYGATDSEPQYHLDQAIIDHGRALGYEMNPAWLW